MSGRDRSDRTGDRAVDEIRLAFPDAGVVDLEPPGHAGPEVLHDDVRAFDASPHSVPSRRPPVVLLDALCGDAMVVAALGRHGIERWPEAGSLRERWPVPAPLSEAALQELYETVGLSVSHLSLLTGHQQSAIRHRLQQAGLSARGGSRSPCHAAANSKR